MLIENNQINFRKIPIHEIDENLKLNNLETIEVSYKNQYISLYEALKKLNKSVSCQFEAKKIKGIYSYFQIVSFKNRKIY